MWVIEERRYWRKRSSTATENGSFGSFKGRVHNLGEGRFFTAISVLLQANLSAYSGSSDRRSRNLPLRGNGWLLYRFLPKAAFRPLMAFSALRPGMFFAGIATADTFRRTECYALLFLRQTGFLHETEKIYVNL
jgi:hypothetical protein